MSIDNKEEIKKLSEMVYIHVSEEEASEFYDTVGNILDFCDKLMELDTASVEPMFTVPEIIFEDVKANLREDKVTDGNYVDEILSNAPDKEDVFIAVPKVIEEQ